MKEIRLKYPADCADCGARLEPGALARYYGPGKVYGSGCHPKNGNGKRSNVTRFAGGAEVMTNARGRCEDAPCCGCCT